MHFAGISGLAAVLIARMASVDERLGGHNELDALPP